MRADSPASTGYAFRDPGAANRLRYQITSVAQRTLPMLLRA